MALFGLGDISFEKNVTNRTGSLGNKFTNNTVRYPIDLGNYDTGHYMMFYIRRQRCTAYNYSGGEQVFGGIPDSLKNTFSKLSDNIAKDIQSGISQISQASGGFFEGLDLFGQMLPGTMSAFDNMFSSIVNVFGGSQQTSNIIKDSIGGIIGGSLSNGRGPLSTTYLTTDAIALYMPNTLAFNQNQQYLNISLNSGERAMGPVAASAIGSILEAYKSKGFSPEMMSDVIQKSATIGGYAAGSGIAAAGQKALSKIGFGNGASDIILKALTGKVQNPMLEMLYMSPNFRTFQFQFMFYPRDEKEAYQVQRIIERFRFHQAPEISLSSIGYLTPPSEFDLKFYYGGSENPNIPQIAPCVLTDVNVDYAPSPLTGFRAYESLSNQSNPNVPEIGKTGMPVAIRLDLTFSEVTYLTKADFNQELK